jgi:hypothetical protein
MRVKTSVAAALFVAAGAAAGAMSTPIAVADSCDPTATVCQGGEVQSGPPSSDYSPPASSTDDQYPFDSEWYFNPAGGGTDLQPNHSSTGGGDGAGGHGGGGGGGHR